jgi:ABC-2 type transport system ATP-binding protein
MAAIEIQNLTKDYKLGFARNRLKRALDALSLQVEAGEIYGLLGPNGAGKSTTLKILFRLIFPTSGTARILGREVHDASLRARVGFLPENPSFYDHLSAEEFMMFSASLHGLTAGEARRRTRDLLERAGLSDSKSLRIRKYSKGMVQRLGIAQALINDPEVVFLDEPMSGLDPLGRRDVRALILDLRQEGKTVFFSTHILSDAETLCDRVAIMNRGKLVGAGELDKLLAVKLSTVEMVIENPSPAVLEALDPYARTMVRTGERVRIEAVQGCEASVLLEKALAAGARVHSLNAVKASLEDYFMAQVGEQEGHRPQAAGNSQAPVGSRHE